MMQISERGEYRVNPRNGKVRKGSARRRNILKTLFAYIPLLISAVAAFTAGPPWGTAIATAFGGYGLYSCYKLYLLHKNDLWYVDALDYHRTKN